jgi:hypothetical protein
MVAAPADAETASATAATKLLIAFIAILAQLNVRKDFSKGRASRCKVLMQRGKSVTYPPTDGLCVNGTDVIS